MSPIDKLQHTFATKGVDFAAILEMHYAFGFVFSTPDFFVMGRPVCSTEAYNLISEPTYTFNENICDAWWVYGMAGQTDKAWNILPHPLPLIGFERFDEIPRFYPISTLKRLTNKT
jgi:hypothetical protein